mmetsp:Transcript_58811/g.124721  ORF Transcript_58811/g.124721 Transcript_58811/m.124721 type:complete len:211 (-) Transcript_58811:1029-1661(-)
MCSRSNWSGCTMHLRSTLPVITNGLILAEPSARTPSTKNLAPEPAVVMEPAFPPPGVKERPPPLPPTISTSPRATSKSPTRARSMGSSLISRRCLWRIAMPTLLLRRRPCKVFDTSLQAFADHRSPKSADAARGSCRSTAELCTAPAAWSDGIQVRLASSATPSSKRKLESDRITQAPQRQEPRKEHSEMPQCRSMHAWKDARKCTAVGS